MSKIMGIKFQEIDVRNYEYTKEVINGEEFVVITNKEYVNPRDLYKKYCNSPIKGRILDWLESEFQIDLETKSTRKKKD